MTALDRIMKSERKRRYKRLKKLWKARDMSSKYVKGTMRISLLDKHISSETHDHYFTANLAKLIVDEQRKIFGTTIRPPRPVARRK